MQTAHAVMPDSMLWTEGVDLLDEVRVQRRRALEVFVKENHAAAVGYARMFFSANLANAEEAVSRTYLQMLQGQTPEKYFFIALKRNAWKLSGELRLVQAVRQHRLPDHDGGRRLRSQGVPLAAPRGRRSARCLDRPGRSSLEKTARS